MQENWGLKRGGNGIKPDGTNGTDGTNRVDPSFVPPPKPWLRWKGRAAEFQLGASPARMGEGHAPIGGKALLWVSEGG